MKRSASPALVIQIDHQRVLHVDQHANRRVDARERLDGKHRVEECAPPATLRLVDLDPHHPQVEQLLDEPIGDLGLLVHGPDQRPDFAIRELVDAFFEQPFIVGKGRQWRVRAVEGRLAHGG
jgi:hypothetical protein